MYLESKNQTVLPNRKKKITALPAGGTTNKLALLRHLLLTKAASHRCAVVGVRVVAVRRVLPPRPPPAGAGATTLLLVLLLELRQAFLDSEKHARVHSGAGLLVALADASLDGDIVVVVVVLVVGGIGGGVHVVYGVVR